MATRISIRRILLLSLALTIAIPATSQVALGDEQPVKSEPPALNASPENLTAPPPEIKPRKEKKSRKKENFEQMERHKDDGYYSSVQTRDVHKGGDFSMQDRHDGEGYYSEMKPTPKEYPKEPEPPKYVPPTPEPAAVVPVQPRPSSSEPGRKFDDDTGASGSITYTRHIKTANEMLHSGHFDLAKKHFKEAINAQPDNPDAYPGFIEACQKAKDWSETQRSIEKYLTLNPGKERDYRWQVAEALFQMQKFDKSTPELKKALGYGHHQDQIHRMLLKTAQIQNNNAEVVNEYNALCKLKPNDYQTQLDYAALLERLAKPQEAIAHYRAATTANPTDGRTMGRLAYLLMYHNKDYDGAINMYMKAMAADPANAKTYQDGVAYCQQQKQLASQPKKK